MPFVENFFEFRTRMACPFLQTAKGYLFQNGGRSDGMEHSDPPTDPTELLRLSIEYDEAQLVIAERKRSQCADYIATQASFHAKGAGPAPGDQAFEDLKQLKIQCALLRHRINENKETLAAQRGPSATMAYHARRDAQRETAAACVAKMREE